jgi:hypothetical protein
MNARPLVCSQIHIVPDWGDKVNSDLEVNNIPQSETMKWATGITYTESWCEISIAFLSLSLYRALIKKGSG